MSKPVKPDEAKQLPEWPEMNKFVKDMLRQELGDREYKVVKKNDHWEIWVDDGLYGIIGISAVEEPPSTEDQKLN
jgi:hypothetical protein